MKSRLHSHASASTSTSFQSHHQPMFIVHPMISSPKHDACRGAHGRRSSEGRAKCMLPRLRSHGFPTTACSAVSKGDGIEPLAPDPLRQHTHEEEPTFDLIPDLGAPELGTAQPLDRSPSSGRAAAAALTRHIKSCRSWRELQGLFISRGWQYNAVHISATVVALRRYGEVWRSMGAGKLGHCGRKAD